jgi:hypothetical protein
MKYHKVTPREIWDKNKLLIISALTILILFFPTGIIHELGHILVCTSNGYDYAFTVGDLALNVRCTSTPQPILWYFALGGIFGLASTLSLFLFKTVRIIPGIFIGVSVTAFDHFLKAIFETFTHSAYLNDPNLSIYMSVLTVSFMLGLFVFFSMSDKSKFKQYMI